MYESTQNAGYEFQPDMFDKPTPLSKSQRRQQRKLRSRAAQMNAPRKPFEPLGPTQQVYFDYLQDTSITQIFAVGEAGTGKTYVPSRFALRRLLEGQIETIYIARPTVSPARHRQGFLPGKLDKKLEPWLAPVIAAFKDETSARQVDTLHQQGKIEFISFEHLRGRTLSDCFVILDEAQNCTMSDLKLFLTRKGENSMYVIAGDPSQVDIPDSGLDTILDMIERQDLTPAILEFGSEDVVRSADAKEWVEAFQRLHE